METAATMTQNRTKQGPQEAARQFIRRVLTAKKWTPNRLGREAKVSPSTVHRALNDDRFVTGNTVLDKIAKAAGIEWSSASAPMGQPGQFGEAEATPYTSEAEIPAELLPADGEAVWRLNTRAIELAGYLPGDLVLVRQGVDAVNGDLVCAQVYNFQQDTAETVWRIYDAPYLVARTMDPSVSTKPLTVDGERVIIWGVVIRCLRVRSS